MNKILEKAFAEACALPDSVQDEVGEIMLNVVASHNSDAHRLTPEQIAEAKEGFAQIKAGNTVPSEKVFKDLKKRLQ